MEPITFEFIIRVLLLQLRASKLLTMNEEING